LTASFACAGFLERLNVFDRLNGLAIRHLGHHKVWADITGVLRSSSPGPYLEIFARGTRANWTYWGNQATDDYEPTWDTYAHNSSAEKKKLTTFPIVVE
jgi:hypothetical protein